MNTKSALANSLCRVGPRCWTAVSGTVSFPPFFAQSREKKTQGISHKGHYCRIYGRDLPGTSKDLGDRLPIASSPGRTDSRRILTHKTYVCYGYADGSAQKRNLKIETSYYHPVNLAGVHKHFYLTCRSSKSERFDANVLDK
jgi:hypothetical protein